MKIVKTIYDNKIVKIIVLCLVLFLYNWNVLILFQAYLPYTCQLGCLADLNQDVMTGEIVLYSNDLLYNTVEKCLSACEKNSFSFAGLSQG